MAYAALITWFTTMLVGLYMLTIWLIERNLTSTDTAASRLPLSVVCGHVALGLVGLSVWVAFLLLDWKSLAWADVGVLGLIATVGFTMFLRWIPVYREPNVPGSDHAVTLGPPTPPERAFPLIVVLGHGLLAVSTLVLVLLTALRRTGH